MMIAKKSVLSGASLWQRESASTSGLVVRCFSLESTKCDKDKYKLLVVGGGSGGLSTGAKFAKKLGAQNVAIVDPSEYHYYQPGWTLVGGGIKTSDQVRRSQKSLIPTGVDWFKSKAASFDPENNTVHLDNGKKIKYDYLIVAAGICTNFNGIKGLSDALKHDDKVVSIYSPIYVDKVFKAFKKFESGNAIFTFPLPPLKCPGAPQKIMYLAEDYFRQNGIRDKAKVIYNTTLPVIFGVKKYAASLMKIVKERDIELNTRTHLVEVDHQNNLAIFEKLDSPGTFVKLNYSLLHVAPPMKPYDVLKTSKLVDATGFVDVHKETLQHKRYPNVYGIGDCTNLPTSKTMAAIGPQSKVLFDNLSNTMVGKEATAKYDGYTSCPLVVSYKKLILAEFDFDGNPLETFPFDQGKESRLMFIMKKSVMPDLYWTGLLKGLWNGPGPFRKLFGKEK